MSTVNHELVDHITTLVGEWTAADRRCRAFFYGWAQRAVRAGLERGFYIQIAQLPGAAQIAETEDQESDGRAIYAAYLSGGLTTQLDIARS